MKHDFSFRSNDYSKLTLLIFNSKFSYVHKQNEAIAINLLVLLEDLCRQLKVAGFISVLSDASRKSMKSVPVLL